jgi:hypothetical protein
MAFRRQKGIAATQTLVRQALGESGEIRRDARRAKRPEKDFSAPQGIKLSRFQIQDEQLIRRLTQINADSQNDRPNLRNSATSADDFSHLYSAKTSESP